jgi:hypothetical protein
MKSEKQKLHLDKLALKKRGTHLSKESKEKIGQAHRKNGHLPPSRLGTKWTDEQRQKHARSVGEGWGN